MTSRHLFFHRLVACVGALQMLALFSVSGQVDPRLARRPLTRIEQRLSEGEQALARARAAANRQDISQAYAEYGTALRMLPRTGQLHTQALRGFTENGVTLARQRLDEGQASEAERIIHEVLRADAKYRPALDLLSRLPVLRFDAPGGGSRSPASKNGVDKGSGFSDKRGGLDRGSGFSDEGSSSAGKDRFSSGKDSSSSGKDSGLSDKRGGSDRGRGSSEKGSSSSGSTTIPKMRPPAASAEPLPTPSTAVEIKKPFVNVFFATDRLRSGAKGPTNYFATSWNREGDHLTTGVITVSIPPTHRKGVVERPLKLWRFERAEDAKKHFILTHLKVEKGDDFYGILRTENAKRAPEGRSAFVFIHGFNVTFDDAAFRTAQLAADFDFLGVPILFSWPSQGALLAYDGDQETVNWSSPHLQDFLERVARESGAERIHLIAHSMGNRLLANALPGLKRQSDLEPLFDNVIMAAPDVNAYSFTDQIWPKIKNAAKRFTLYASSQDQALRASKAAKGRHDFDRLGEAGPKLVVISGLDTVDASGIDTSLLGHSYVDSCKPVIEDVASLIVKGFTPRQRKLDDKYKAGLVYWLFPKN